MNISKTYDPSKAEEKWYNKWVNAGLFKSLPDDREPYTIVIPPPNVTGVLHMGHMLNCAPIFTNIDIFYYDTSSDSPN